MNVKTDLAFVVEDHKDLANLYAHTLESVGYQVEIFHHGKDALERLQIEPAPQLVLLDMHYDNGAGTAPIPSGSTQLTGNEVAWHLWFELDQTYIIIITGYDNYKEIYGPMQEIDKVYVKPVPLDILADEVKKYLNVPGQRKLSTDINPRR
jgi:CheY-like chemotaxis protein